MIKIQRTAKPAILQKNSEIWLEKLRTAVTDKERERAQDK